MRCRQVCVILSVLILILNGAGATYRIRPIRKSIYRQYYNRYRGYRNGYSSHYRPHQRSLGRVFGRQRYLPQSLPQFRFGNQHGDRHFRRGDRNVGLRPIPISTLPRPLRPALPRLRRPNPTFPAQCQRYEVLICTTTRRGIVSGKCFSICRGGRPCYKPCVCTCVRRPQIGRYVSHERSPLLPLGRKPAIPWCPISRILQCKARAYSSATNKLCSQACSDGVCPISCNCACVIERPFRNNFNNNIPKPERRFGSGQGFIGGPRQPRPASDASIFDRSPDIFHGIMGNDVIGNDRLRFDNDISRFARPFGDNAGIILDMQGGRDFNRPNLPDFRRRPRHRQDAGLNGFDVGSSGVTFSNDVNNRQRSHSRFPIRPNFNNVNRPDANFRPFPSAAFGVNSQTGGPQFGFGNEPEGGFASDRNIPSFDFPDLQSIDRLDIPLDNGLLNNVRDGPGFSDFNIGSDPSNGFIGMNIPDFGPLGVDAGIIDSVIGGEGRVGIGPSKKKKKKKPKKVTETVDIKVDVIKKDSKKDSQKKDGPSLLPVGDPSGGAPLPFPVNNPNGGSSVPFPIPKNGPAGFANGPFIDEGFGTPPDFTLDAKRVPNVPLPSNGNSFRGLGDVAIGPPLDLPFGGPLDGSGLNGGGSNTSPSGPPVGILVDGTVDGSFDLGSGSLGSALGTGGIDNTIDNNLNAEPNGPNFGGNFGTLSGTGLEPDLGSNLGPSLGQDMGGSSFGSNFDSLPGQVVDTPGPSRNFGTSVNPGTSGPGIDGNFGPSLGQGVEGPGLGMDFGPSLIQGPNGGGFRSELRPAFDTSNFDGNSGSSIGQSSQPVDPGALFDPIIQESSTGIPGMNDPIFLLDPTQPPQNSRELGIISNPRVNGLDAGGGTPNLGTINDLGVDLSSINLETLTGAPVNSPGGLPIDFNGNGNVIDSPGGELNGGLVSDPSGGGIFDSGSAAGSIIGIAEQGSTNSEPKGLILDLAGIMPFGFSDGINTSNDLQNSGDISGNSSPTFI